MSGRVATVTNSRPTKPTSKVHKTGTFSTSALSRLGKSEPNGAGNLAMRSDRVTALHAMGERMAGAEIGTAMGTMLGVCGGEAVPIVRHVADQPAGPAGQDVRQLGMQCFAKRRGDILLQPPGVVIGER